MAQHNCTKDNIINDLRTKVAILERLTVSQENEINNLRNKNNKNIYFQITTLVGIIYILIDKIL